MHRNCEPSGLIQRLANASQRSRASASSQAYSDLTGAGATWRPGTRAGSRGRIDNPFGEPGRLVPGERKNRSG